MKKILLILLCTGMCWSCAAAKAHRLLPKPDTTGGKPLMQVLSQRKTSRSFSEKSIPRDVLSNLLWAAFGINRPKKGKRTAPSAMNFQEIDIYLSMEEGVFLYHAQDHSIEQVSKKDIRAVTGLQEFVKDAPLNLIYVANMKKMNGDNKRDNEIYAAFDTGFISQNVYLFCASEGLGTVIRGYVDKPVLAEAMGLKDHQFIVASQTVGYEE
jgi:SagB-type dehydrogenase family enzyme